jgi:hypothetical protein
VRWVWSCLWSFRVHEKRCSGLHCVSPARPPQEYAARLRCRVNPYVFRSSCNSGLGSSGQRPAETSSVFGGRDQSAPSAGVARSEALH